MIYNIATAFSAISILVFNVASCVTSADSGDFDKYGKSFILGIVFINILLITQFFISHLFLKQTKDMKKIDYSYIPICAISILFSILIMLCGVIFMIIPQLNIFYGIIASAVLLLINIIWLVAKTKTFNKIKTAFLKFVSRKFVKIVLIPSFCLIIAFIIVFFTYLSPLIKYNSAVKSIENGNVFSGAYTLSTINFKDSKQIFEKSLETNQNLKILSSNIRDTVKLGRYEQDNNLENGSEEIEWLVLDKIDSKVLLVSKYCLDTIQYNVDCTDITWEDSTIRNWLNNDFKNAAFNQEELSLIFNKKLINKKNLFYYRTSGGNSTKDNVFILSYYEADHYLKGSGNFSAQSTKYCIARGAYRNADSLKSWWWLRTPGSENTYSTYAPINETTSASKIGYHVDRDDITVRPAIWIDFNNK